MSVRPRIPFVRKSSQDLDARIWMLESSPWTDRDLYAPMVPERWSQYEVNMVSRMSSRWTQTCLVSSLSLLLSRKWCHCAQYTKQYQISLFSDRHDYSQQRPFQVRGFSSWLTGGVPLEAQRRHTCSPTSCHPIRPVTHRRRDATVEDPPPVPEAHWRLTVCRGLKGVLNKM